MSKFKRALKQIFLTHIGRIFFVAGPLMLIGGIMSPNGTIGEHIDYKNNTTVFDILFYIGCAVFLFEGSLMLFWAAKNTIKELLNRKNKK